MLCKAWHALDVNVCWAKFTGCITTSDEVLLLLAAGAITIAAILAILEPTPAGEAALAILLAGI